MKNKYLLLILNLMLFSFVNGQQDQPTLLVNPYLQDATPNSIKIMWQTSSGEESIVEWGTTQKLGKKTEGLASDINFTDSRIHEVQIKNLKRFTTYFYRVRTEKVVSDIFQFKTPPFASDNQSFNMLAMSDIQKDHQNPDKFSEIVNEGILPYLKTEYGKAFPDNLALVLVPGDLVENGTKYEQWQNDFFGPAKKLFSEIPVYPVLGNHEKNSAYYFKYFSLPKNGTPAYAEHWWFKDYGNTRIIGLNSNDGYRDIEEQYLMVKRSVVKNGQKPGYRLCIRSIAPSAQIGTMDTRRRRIHWKSN
ncbi:fibronectin type III domain-containing protein [Zobellia laminariae]|uniref:fibronectin type III domain-containing protein n=1 Tax=Zobellia laminariae TaxID=248906 RepID=UPI0026F40A34|nr:fibronectin type III domain-containing protein [Zobellia laminariae]WKX77845.1 fibronectin type III domain-containing protein [Zobellia laminariae]